MTQSRTSLYSPLHQRHEELGAKFAEFGGWNMPLEYANAGVVAEHTAVRTGVGIFDVSHLGKIDVVGPGAAAFVNDCLSNDLRKIEPSKAQYTMCCDESGGVVDDMIAYLYGDDRVFLVPNAANNAEVARRLAEVAGPDIAVTDCHRDYAVLAVQGPKSAEVLDAAGLPRASGFMSFEETEFAGSDGDTCRIVVCRTGYTGEHGYELVIPSTHAVAVWDALMAAGENASIQPAGLGARDTLRLEAGLSLHGHELSRSITPVQAKSSWAVGWKKERFWGKEALTKEKEQGPAHRIYGLEVTGRGIPRAEMTVYNGDDAIGTTTSGTYSPTKKVGIALALLNTSAGIELGAQLHIDVRGRRVPVEVVKPPFIGTR